MVGWRSSRNSFHTWSKCVLENCHMTHGTFCCFFARHEHFSSHQEPRHVRGYGVGHEHCVATTCEHSEPLLGQRRVVRRPWVLQKTGTRRRGKNTDCEGIAVAILLVYEKNGLDDGNDKNVRLNYNSDGFIGYYDNTFAVGVFFMHYATRRGSCGDSKIATTHSYGCDIVPCVFATLFCTRLSVWRTIVRLPAKLVMLHAEKPLSTWL